MLPLQSNSNVDATSVSVDRVVIETSATLHSDASSTRANNYSVSKNAPTLKRYSLKLKGSILMKFSRNIPTTLE